MANKITVQFEAKGAGALKTAISNLSKEQGKFEKKQHLVNQRVSRNTELHERQNKILGTLKGKFAVLRNSLLLYAFGYQILAKTIGATVKAYAEQQLSEKKLEQALGRTSDALLSQASALQQVSTFGDETIISAQALIAAFVDDEEQIKAATAATLDLAAAKGMDLNAAADLVSKTLGSTTNSLSRYGIEVEGAVGSTERLESLTKSVADVFGGQAKAQADTLSGSISQMKNAMGDTAEVMGSTLAPIIKSIANFLKEAAEGATEFIRGLTETPLESTIRQLELLGVEAESLIRLKDIQLNKEIRILNEELKKVNKESLSQENIDSRLTEIAKERVDVNRSLADIQSKMEDKALDNLKLQITGVRERFMRERQLMEDGNHTRQDFYNSETRERETIQAMYDDFYKNQGEEEKIRLSQLDSEEESLLGVATVMAQILGLEIQVSNLKSGGSGKGAENALTKEELDLGLKLMQMRNDTLANEGAMTEFRAEKLNILAELNLAREQERLGMIDAVDLTMAEAQAKLDLSDVEKKLRQEQAKTSEEKAKQVQDSMKNSMLAAAKQEGTSEAIAEALFGEARAQMQAAILKAVASALTAVPFPANIIAAKGAAAAVEKLIPPIKLEQGGMVGGRRHSQGGTMIEAEQGEFVMSRDAVDSIGAGNLEAMNQGGGGAVTVNVSGNVMTDDFVEDVLAEKIAAAVRRGADFGIS